MHGREKQGQLDEFGVSGYVYKDTFLIFDRKTESLWYPFDDTKWTAIAGPRTEEQWRENLDALDGSFDAEDEKLVDGLVETGHPSTPGYNDPAYPLEGRIARSG